jgi:hypothetical protein
MTGISFKPIDTPQGRKIEVRIFRGRPHYETLVTRELTAHEARNAARHILEWTRPTAREVALKLLRSLPHQLKPR